MNYISNDINDPITLRLIAAALELHQAQGIAASITPLPGIGKYITIGTPEEVARLLEIAPAPVAQERSPVAEVRDQALTEAVKALFWKFEKGAAPFKVGYSLKQLEKDDREVSIEPGDMYSIFEAAGLIKSTTNKSEG